MPGHIITCPSDSATSTGGDPVRRGLGDSAGGGDRSDRTESGDRTEGGGDAASRERVFSNSSCSAMKIKSSSAIRCVVPHPHNLSHRTARNQAPSHPQQRTRASAWSRISEVGGFALRQVTLFPGSFTRPT